jgi:hypothetical protein
VREVAQSRNLRRPESWLFEGPGEDLYFSLGNGDRPILATWVDMIKLEDLERNNIAYNVAKRFRSAAGYSTDPTPAAACPFSGKNPWRPSMAEKALRPWD